MTWPHFFFPSFEHHTLARNSDVVCVCIRRFSVWGISFMCENSVRLIGCVTASYIYRCSVFSWGRRVALHLQISVHCFSRFFLKYRNLLKIEMLLLHVNMEILSLRNFFHVRKSVSLIGVYYGKLDLCFSVSSWGWWMALHHQMSVQLFFPHMFGRLLVIQSKLMTWLTIFLLCLFFPSSEDHILFEIEMLLEFIPALFFVFFGSFGPLGTYGDSQTEDFILCENSVRKLDFLMLNIFRRGWWTARHLQMSVHWSFVTSLVFLNFWSYNAHLSWWHGLGQHCSEFGLQNGTTYNSFIIEGDKLAVVDASHEKFRDLYLSALKEEIDPSNIDYILANHTEPDHSGLIPDLLDLAPDAVVVGSKVCIQFLQNLMNRPFKSKVVKVFLQCPSANHFSSVNFVCIRQCMHALLLRIVVTLGAFAA